MKEIAMADELRVLKMECERSLGEAERQISEYSARSDEIGAELRALASAPSTPSHKLVACTLRTRAPSRWHERQMWSQRAGR